MPTLPPARTPFGGRESHQARQIAESFGLGCRPLRPGPAPLPRRAGGPDQPRAQPRRPEVLDVGCGTGIAARQFQAAGCRVLGVDPDARMADLARRQRARGRGVDVRGLGQRRPGIRRGCCRAGLALGGPGGRRGRGGGGAAARRAAGRVLERVPAPVRPGRSVRRDLPSGAARFAALPGRSRAGGRTLTGGRAPEAAEGMRQAAAFGEPEQWRFDWDRRYTRDEWLDQLPTSGFWAQIPRPGSGRSWRGSAPPSTRRGAAS